MSMSSGGAIRAGRAFIELFADRSKLVADLKVAESNVRQFGLNVAKIGGSMVAMGTAILGPLVGAAKLFADTGSQFDDIANRTGIAASAISELAYAAQMSGTSIEAVEKASIKLEKTLGDAATGSETAARAFEDIGLSVSDLMTMNPEQRFLAVSRALGAVDDMAIKTSATMELFGKSGADLFAFMGEMDQHLGTSRKLGLGMSDEDVANAAALGDAMDTLWATIKRLTVGVGAALAPALTKLATIAANVVSVAVKWMDENRGIVVAIAAVGAALVTVGSALTALGVTIAASTIALAGLSAAFAFVATPLVGVIAGVAALGAGLLYVTGTLKAVRDATREAFGTLGRAISGVTDALIAADWQGAGEIAMLGLRLAIAKGIRDIDKDLKASLLFNTLFGPAGVIGMAVGRGWVKQIDDMERQLDEMLAAFQKRAENLRKGGDEDEEDDKRPRFINAGGRAVGTFNPFAIPGTFGGSVGHDIKEIKRHAARVVQVIEPIARAAGDLKQWGLKQVGFANNNIPLSLPHDRFLPPEFGE